MLRHGCHLVPCYVRTYVMFKEEASVVHPKWYAQRFQEFMMGLLPSTHESSSAVSTSDAFGNYSDSSDEI